MASVEQPVVEKQEVIKTEIVSAEPVKPEMSVTDMLTTYVIVINIVSITVALAAFLIYLFRRKSKDKTGNKVEETFEKKTKTVVVEKDKKKK